MVSLKILGLEKVNFGPNEVGAFDGDTQQIEYEAYSYEKITATTARIILGTAGSDTEEVELTFVEPNYAEGTWIEVDGGETFEGTLTFVFWWEVRILLEQILITPVLMQVREEVIHPLVFLLKGLMEW